MVQPVWADDAGGFHVLKGRIIRSLAIDGNDPAHILVGHKAKRPGAALVFRSVDGGRTWRTLNGNKSLHPDATDVQAVLPVSKKVMLAGTWKHGLYISLNGGSRFDRIQRFSSSDIRDLQSAGGTIFAATARHGVFESTDDGQTWAALGPGEDFLWSMTLAGDRMFASTPEKAVYERPFRGGTWRKIFQADGANAIAFTPGSGGLRAIAGAKGLYISVSSDWRKFLDGENFADIVISRNNRIVAGSWDNGVAVLTSGGSQDKRLLKGQAVLHVQFAKRRLYAGTWGDGLHVIPLAQVLVRSQTDTPLIAAVLRDDLADVRRLLVAGAKVDDHDKSRNTAMIFAARDGQTDIASLLIDAGADPGWIDGEGVTPLILAALKNHPDMVKLLLAQKKKARTNHADKGGRTARDYAKRRGPNDPIYKMLTR
jgi:hypothetical protein